MVDENVNVRRQRFLKIASKRVQKLLDDMELLSNCSNRNNYEYSESDVKRMMSAIRTKVKHLENSFLDQKDNRKDTFKF